jgi:hypothetical protein
MNKGVHEFRVALAYIGYIVWRMEFEIIKLVRHMTIVLQLADFFLSKIMVSLFRGKGSQESLFLLMTTSLLLGGWNLNELVVDNLPQRFMYVLVCPFIRPFCKEACEPIDDTFLRGLWRPLTINSRWTLETGSAGFPALSALGVFWLAWLVWSILKILRHSVRMIST